MDDNHIQTYQDINETDPVLGVDENAIYNTYLPIINSSSKYTRLVMYTLGFPGNIVAFLVWTRKPMLQSSGVYLAVLSLSDVLFLALDLLYSLQTEWNIDVLDYPVLCEAFTISYMTSQYTSPMLTFAFTTERFIAIKFPLKRRIYCTVKRAICTSVVLVVVSSGLCAIQGYFWTYDTYIGACSRRVNTDNIWETYTWATEMIMFLVVPVFILMLNILVIEEIRRARNVALKLNRIMFKTNATTTMLLAASTFLILTTLPVSIVYALSDRYPPGQTLENILENSVWQAHFRYYTARTIIYNIGLTHFFMNFYIYLMAGERFRKEVLRVLRCRSDQRFRTTLHRLDHTKFESFGSSETI